MTTSFYQEPDQGINKPAPQKNSISETPQVTESIYKRTDVLDCYEDGYAASKYLQHSYCLENMIHFCYAKIIFVNAEASTFIWNKANSPSKKAGLLKY